MRGERGLDELYAGGGCAERDARGRAFRFGGDRMALPGIDLPVLDGDPVESNVEQSVLAQHFDRAEQPRTHYPTQHT